VRAKKKDRDNVGPALTSPGNTKKLSRSNLDKLQGKAKYAKRKSLRTANEMLAGKRGGGGGGVVHTVSNYYRTKPGRGTTEYFTERERRV